MPERAFKEDMEDRGVQRRAVRSRTRGTRFRSLGMIMASVAFLNGRILAILITLGIFCAFATNALFLQTGFRSGTILDDFDIPLLPSRNMKSDISPDRGNLGLAQASLASIPLPRNRPDAGNENSSDQIDALLARTADSAMLPQTIVYIQQTLNKLGYGPLDEGGVYSNSVRLAISRFEKDRRMHPTGEIDAALVRELGRASGVPLE